MRKLSLGKPQNKNIEGSDEIVAADSKVGTDWSKELWFYGFWREFAANCKGVHKLKLCDFDEFHGKLSWIAQMSEDCSQDLWFDGFWRIVASDCTEGRGVEYRSVV